MKNKTITSLLILQLFAFPCMAMEDDKQEESPSVQVQVEQIEEINNVNHSIFSNDEAPIIFTLRELYTAARSEDARAKKLVEYLGEMFGHTIKALYQVEDENFSFEGKNLDRQYTLPVEHFTQKMLDEPLWGIDIKETGLDKLFPEPIREGATYEAIQALKKVIDDEKDEPYFSEQDGQVLLARMVIDAARILEEKNKTLQTFEAEKIEFEQILAKTDILVNEVKAQFEQTKEENSKLTAALQEKEITLEEVLQREANVISVKEQLEISLADTEHKYSKLQVEHEETLVALENSNNELEALKQKVLAYEEMIKQASAILNIQQNV